MSDARTPRPFIRPDVGGLALQAQHFSAPVRRLTFRVIDHVYRLEKLLAEARCIIDESAGAGSSPDMQAFIAEIDEALRGQ